MKPLSKTIENLKPSGIRKFFDLASTMDNVISFGVGEPDFDTPWHICENAVYSMSEGKTHYTANRGLLELRKLIAEFHRIRYDQHYNPENEILVTVGGSEAIDLAMRAMINPGDEVITMDPNYVAYTPAIEMAGGIPVIIPLEEKSEFKLTPEALKNAITDKTKAILINFPSNPTGGVMTYEDYEKLVPIIEESGIYVVSDEIYAELTFDGEFASLAQFPSIRDQIVVINGFSKAFAMTGWRLGYVMSNPHLSSAMTKIHQYIIMSAPTPAQYAALEAMTNGLSDVSHMHNEYMNRRNLLVSRLNRMGLKTNMPHGTFYVFPNISQTGLTSEEFCNRLVEEQRVACVPGTAFGEKGEGFMRMSYACSMDNIIEGCDRIEAFLASLDQKQEENPSNRS